MASASSEISFVAHPPERGSRLPTGLFCGCSCCCCCCLHTVGGVIGAVRAAKATDAPEAGMVSEPSPTGAVADAAAPLKTSDVGFYYWGTVATLVGLSAIGGWMGLGASLLLLPALQLAAALLVAVGVAMGPRDLRPAALRYLWKVSVGMMVGTLLGFLAMGGLGVMLMGMK